MTNLDWPKDAKLRNNVLYLGAKVDRISRPWLLFIGIITE